jgi:hypothetical protein
MLGSAVMQTICHGPLIWLHWRSTAVLLADPGSPNPHYLLAVSSRVRGLKRQLGDWKRWPRSAAGSGFPDRW